MQMAVTDRLLFLYVISRHVPSLQNALKEGSLGDHEVALLPAVYLLQRVGLNLGYVFSGDTCARLRCKKLNNDFDVMARAFTIDQEELDSLHRDFESAIDMLTDDVLNEAREHLGRVTQTKKELVDFDSRHPSFVLEAERAYQKIAPLMMIPDGFPEELDVSKWGELIVGYLIIFDQHVHDPQNVAREFSKKHRKLVPYLRRVTKLLTECGLK